MKDIVKKSLEEIREDIAAGRVSSVEATEATLESIKEQEDLGAYVTVCEKALDAARAADKAVAEGKRAPLLGVPVAVKDNICTEGGQSQYGRIRDGLDERVFGV